MERIRRIWENKLYQEYLRKIEAHEKDRVFCRHDRKHFLDVSRIAYILYLEEMAVTGDKEGESKEIKEILYAAGLLHDIGRWKEYEEGIGHHIASAGLAQELLKECGFSEREREEITTIILSHRKKEVAQEKSLSGIFYRADKESRECYWCEASKQCNWKTKKKQCNY